MLQEFQSAFVWNRKPGKGLNMDTISNKVWQRRGSCVIFDKASLGSFIPDGAVVSLRQAWHGLKRFRLIHPCPDAPFSFLALRRLLK